MTDMGTEQVKQRASVTLREGDIYRWSYRDPKTSAGNYGDYHCCSRIAIVDDRGWLCDTYWSVGRDGRAFIQSDLTKLDLTYLGNMSELKRTNEYQADYYDVADIVNLNHSNSSVGNFYIRKGAYRSAKKMLEVARKKLEVSISNELAAVRRAQELREKIARIEAGDIDFYL